MKHIMRALPVNSSPDPTWRAWVTQSCPGEISGPSVTDSEKSHLKFTQWWVFVDKSYYVEAPGRLWTPISLESERLQAQPPPTLGFH